MQIYWSARSPFVRKVMVAAIELGLDDRIERIPCEPADMDPSFVAANPIARIPTLVTDDGMALPESDLIVAYLDDLAGQRLIPDGAARWAVLRQQALADGAMEAAVALLGESRRPEGERSATQIAKLTARIGRCFDALEAEAAAGRLDGALTVGQVAAGCACGYADFRFPDLAWREGRPRLAAWFATFGERPAMAATRPHL